MSLVRNSGQLDSSSASIGFLKVCHIHGVNLTFLNVSFRALIGSTLRFLEQSMASSYSVTRLISDKTLHGIKSSRRWKSGDRSARRSQPHATVIRSKHDLSRSPVSSRCMHQKAVVPSLAPPACRVVTFARLLYVFSLPVVRHALTLDIVPRRS